MIPTERFAIIKSLALAPQGGSQKSKVKSQKEDSKAFKRFRMVNLFMPTYKIQMEDKNVLELIPPKHLGQAIMVKEG